MTGVERWYERQLRKIAKHVGDIIGAFPAGSPSSVDPIRHALFGYSEVIDSWARAQAAAMLARVNKADEQVWRDRSVEMASWVRRELDDTPVGETMRKLLAGQVGLIKSIPLDAAQRVHDMTQESLMNPARASELAKAIAASGEVSKSRATLIARTETTRASSTLTEARALHLGSEGYIWRTSNDGDVRHSHAEMNGKFVYWARPPTLDGLTGHAGCLPNCRCWCDPVIPD